MSNRDYGFPANTVFCVMLGNQLVQIFKDWKAANEYADTMTIKDMKAGHDVEYMVNAEPLF